jgi:hypothetical protein
MKKNKCRKNKCNIVNGLSFKRSLVAAMTFVPTDAAHATNAEQDYSFILFSVIILSRTFIKTNEMCQSIRKNW